jgi:PAS domain S-box-containing protein
MLKKDKKKNSEDRSRQLRVDAEARFSLSPRLPPELEKMTYEKLVEELRVHQIELEMQNEELKAAQLTLEKEARDQYADLYDFAPIGYFTFNRDALIVETNLVGGTLLGVARQDLINQRFRKFIAPSDIDRWDRHITSIFQHGIKQHCALLLSRADGSTFYAHFESIRVDLPAIENKPLEFAMRTVITDITESKQAESQRETAREALKENEALLSEMTTQVPGVVYQFYARPNGEMGFYYVSDRSERILGLKPDLAGYLERFAALIIPEHRDGFIKSIEKSVKESSEWNYEGILQKPSGEKIWFSGNSNPSPRENEIVFNGIVSDITERKKTEEELRKRLQELEVFYKASIGREERILELKKKIAELEEKHQK